MQRISQNVYDPDIYIFNRKMEQKKVTIYFNVTAASRLRYSSSFTNCTFHKQEFCS